jgi:2-phosphoglycerate kinase
MAPVDSWEVEKEDEEEQRKEQRKTASDKKNPKHQLIKHLKKTRRRNEKRPLKPIPVFH